MKDYARMSTFCLDTNVISLLTTGRHPLSDEMRAWFDDNVESCYASAVSLFEMAFGSLRLIIRKSTDDCIRAHRISIVNKLFLLKMSSRIISIDADILVRAAGLRALAERSCGDIGPCDAIIAASADLRGHALVTLNVKHFAATDIRCIGVTDLLQKCAAAA